MNRKGSPEHTGGQAQDSEPESETSFTESTPQHHYLRGEPAEEEGVEETKARSDDEDDDADTPLPAVADLSEHTLSREESSDTASVLERIKKVPFLLSHSPNTSTDHLLAFQLRLLVRSYLDPSNNPSNNPTNPSISLANPFYRCRFPSLSV